MKNISMRTAVGPDGLNREMVRAVDVHTWKHWFNQFLDCGHLPKMLRQFRLMLIPKVDESKSPGDYGPISVGLVARKLYSMVLNARLSKIEQELEQIKLLL